MKYDSFDDVLYFIIGASIASGSVFWLGKEGRFNKELKEYIDEISPGIRELDVQHIKKEVAKGFTSEIIRVRRKTTLEN